MYLISYTVFWIASFLTDFIVLGFFLLLIPETMPDTLRKPLDMWDLNPFVYYWRAIKITMKYPLLMGILPCIFIGSFAGAGMGAVAVNQLWVGVLKFTQPEGLVPQLIGLICGIPANIIGAIVIPRIGVWPAIFFGNSVGTVLGLLTTLWPIWWLNQHHPGADGHPGGDCWGADALAICGDGQCESPPPSPSPRGPTAACCLLTRGPRWFGTGDCPADDHWWTCLHHQKALYWAKWGGTVTGTIIGSFIGAISGPATTAMISMQVA